MMGIRFPENFNYPYLANSPRDLWRRWHISLSSWIRDYLYLPLAGIRVHDRSTGGLAEAAEKVKKDARQTRPTGALFLTWAIMGLWHGANWTFVCWGLYHGLLVFMYRKIAGHLKGLPRWFHDYGGWMLTLPFTMLGWILFRCDSLSQAFSMYAKVLDLRQYFSLGLRENIYLVTVLLLVGILMSFGVRTFVLPFLYRRPNSLAAAETVLFTVVVGLVFVFLRPIYQFIYFQF
jgi:D-alanyl-lipoteichoic acid acyltransferase DltB (MBOAT superfamily)